MRSGGGFARAVSLAGLVATLTACGEDASDRIVLMSTAEWIQDPGSVAGLGYHVLADVGWVDRAGACARIPGELRVTVNQIEADRIGSTADCDFDGLFDGRPFTTPDPVTVRVFDHDRQLGEATFEGMFWGMQARLVSPAGGQVHPGDQIVVSIPPGKGSPALKYAVWYWLDTAASVPPFYTTSEAVLGSDQTTISAQVPTLEGLTGRVALTFTYALGDQLAATTCTGFAACSMNASYTLGPIAIDVLAH